MEVEKIVKIIARRLKKSENEIYEEIEKKKKEFFDMINDLAAAYLIAYEVGIKPAEELESLKISDIGPGMKNISIEGIIKRKFRPIETEKGIFQSFIIWDGENEAKVTVWSKTLVETLKRIPEGSRIRIIGGRAGKNGINLDSNSKIILIEKGYGKRIYIKDFEEGKRGYVIGTVLKKFEPKKFSGGTLQAFIVDDGTKVARFVYFGETEIEEWKDYVFVGRVKRNIYTNKLEFVVSEIEEFDPKKLLKLIVV